MPVLINEFDVETPREKQAEEAEEKEKAVVVAQRLPTHQELDDFFRRREQRRARLAAH